jgi:hypothetical protein
VTDELAAWESAWFPFTCTITGPAPGLSFTIWIATFTGSVCTAFAPAAAPCSVPLACRTPWTLLPPPPEPPPPGAGCEAGESCFVALAFEAFAADEFAFVCTITGLAPGLEMTICTATFTGLVCVELAAEAAC